ITDHYSWRWLFFVNVPFALAALAVVWAYMHVPQHKRRHAIDVADIVTISLGLTAVLVATVSGGVQWGWNSWQVIGLYAAGTLLLAMFVWNENRAPEPLLPMRLCQNGIFTWSNVANMAVAMGMF